MKRTVSVLVTLNPILHVKGKAYAAANNLSFSGFMNDLLKDALDDAGLPPLLTGPQLAAKLKEMIERKNAEIDEITKAEAKRKPRKKITSKKPKP